MGKCLSLAEVLSTYNEGIQNIAKSRQMSKMSTEKSKLKVVIGKFGESELSCVSTADVALYRTVQYDQPFHILKSLSSTHELDKFSAPSQEQK